MSILTHVRDAVGSLADRAIDLALPVTCAGCYRPGTTLCRDCHAALTVRLAAGAGVPAALADALPGPLRQLESCGPFDGITRRALERLSAAGERRVSEPLGTAIANRWANVGTGGDVLVPVPASSDRVRDIGYDHAELLARVAGRRLGLPVTKALLRLPAVAPVGIVQAGRDTLVGTAFEVIAAPRIAGRSVLLVDDVVVTGTTLATCASALLAAGARMVSAVTVARDHWSVPKPVTRRAAG